MDADMGGSHDFTEQSHLLSSMAENMVASPTGLGSENECAGEGQQQL
jgi:hypothetical protein